MKTLVILNHELTDEQKTELNSEIFVLSDDNKKLWNSILPEYNKFMVSVYIRDIVDSIYKYDQVVCRGEFTAFTTVLEVCRLYKIPLLVACSKRETIEKVDSDGKSTKVSVFKHIQFREV